MRKAVGWKIDNLLQQINSGVIPHSLLTQIFIYYASEDLSALERLLTETRPSVLGVVYGILDGFPHTDAGWKILPHCRSAYMTENLTIQEEADIESQLFQEDRDFVELVRTRIRQSELGLT